MKTAKPGEWIYGRGWHQEKWTRSRRRTSRASRRTTSLSKVSPNNPVLLTHASGHASFANAKAMELSDIDGDDAEPGRRRHPQGRDGQPDRRCCARPRRG